MTCGICIGVSDVDPAPSFCKETVRKARKAYKCSECAEVIPDGARYVHIVGKWDGVLQTFRQCPCCHEIQQVFSCDQGWLYGGLWESWDDLDGFANLTVRDPCFNKLSMEARAFLTKRWWDWKERQAQ